MLNNPNLACYIISVSTKIISNYGNENGKFLQPDITLEKMEALIRGKMKEMGMPGFIAKLLTMGTSKLERWKK